MKWITLLLVGLSLALAACQSMNTAENIPPSPTPLSTPSGGTPVPLALDLSGLDAEHFRVRYLDPVTGEFATLTGKSYYSEARNLTGALMYLNDESNPDVMVVFAIPENVQPGTYYLADYNAAFSDDNKTVDIVGATIAIGNYFELHEGTVTITGVAPLTGAFQFKGIAEPDETQKVEITVDGALNAIPFIKGQ